jgi:pimeloyl-ACP methyl ester carboxylesterase
MTQVQINGISLEYLEDGTGIPVVFSHGGYSDLRYWEPQREVFGARYRFVAYSHRFHGGSSWPEDTEYSAQAHVSDLFGILRRLEAGPVHLIGFSTAIALRVVLQEPELVRSLTIIEPNVPWLLEGDPEGELILAWWRDEKARVAAEAAGDEVQAAKLWFELVNNRGPHAFDTQPESFRQMWLNNFARKRPVATAEPLTCEKLSAITTPTLAIGAEYGMPYSRQIVGELSKCISRCRLVIVPGVTHFMSYQDPVTFNELILNFLEQH